MLFISSFFRFGLLFSFLAVFFFSSVLFVSVRQPLNALIFLFYQCNVLLGVSFLYFFLVAFSFYILARHSAKKYSLTRNNFTFENTQ